MRKTYLAHIMASHYYKAVFALSFVAAYFLVPKPVFEGTHILLGVSFMLAFALIFTCLIRNLKEKIFAAKISGGSLAGAVATAVGWSALQVCTLNCTAGFGAALLFALLPSIFMNFLISYSIPLLLLSILVQAAALYRMRCFQPLDTRYPHRPKFKV